MAITNNLPIEAALTTVYSQVEDDSTKDLRGMVTKVEENMAQKDLLRKAQKEIEMMRDAQKAGDSAGFYAHRNAATTALQQAGVPANDPILAKLGTGGPAGTSFAVTGNDEQKNTIRDKWDSWFKGLDRMVDGEMQARSDIGQKLQFQLNEANSIYNRSIQAKSNIASTHNKTADALVQNIRG